MSLEKPQNKAIKAYISSNGWWNVTKDIWLLWLLSPISLSPITQDPQNLSRILIVHTEDDERIPFSQISYFKNWVNQAKKEPNYQLVVFPTGGHTYIANSKYPTNEFFNHMLTFLNHP